MWYWTTIFGIKDNSLCVQTFYLVSSDISLYSNLMSDLKHFAWGHTSHLKSNLVSKFNLLDILFSVFYNLHQMHIFSYHSRNFHKHIHCTFIMSSPHFKIHTFLYELLRLIDKTYRKCKKEVDNIIFVIQYNAT